MLTLLAPQPESLWDESLPVEVKELPEDLAALDVLLADPKLLWPLVERWQREFQESGRLVLTEGVPDADGGGVGLDSSASVLPNQPVRAGAGRVDGSQVDQADRRRDGVGDDAGADRGGHAREAVPSASGEDRLDGDRGGCEVSDRRGVGVERGARPGQRGPQAREAREGQEGTGAG